MNRILIYEYINRLKREDIIKFCTIKKINVSNTEIDIIYSYIKNEYKRFFNNPIEVLDEIKGKVSDKVFKEIMILYDKYKYKIK